MYTVRYAVEGFTDEPVAEKLLLGSGFSPAPGLIARSKARLDEVLQGLNRSASRTTPWVVLRDLDQDDREICVPALHSHLLDGPANQGMIFRLVVRSTEAWLMADRAGLAEFFAVQKPLPHDPDDLANPRLALVNLCRRSKRKDISRGIPPRDGSRRVVGSEYGAYLREFGESHWDPQRARVNSPSLDRALGSLATMRAELERSAS